ncbi:MAG: adenylosuccinate synthase [Dehalococcoidales bacterium]|nr:adenylosuccinate synthase [Dehalococcoidales bacterium]
MPVIAVIGAQWGDEGKGKIVDMLAEKVQMVVRFSGGDNAGHTVVNQYGEFGLHLVPSGIFSPRATCLIANGAVIKPDVLLKEIDLIKNRGVDTSRLFISDRANVIMPYHILFDGLEEEVRGGKAIGTTRKGIGPAYSDKVARMGIRVGDLLDKDGFLDRLRGILKYKNDILTKIFNVNALSLYEVYSEYCAYGEQLAPYVRDGVTMLEAALDRNEWVLMEGAQGTLLDPDFGTYPFTTSSSPMAGGACTGAGLGPTRMTHVLGIFKAYCTRVGGGPMVTELKDETGNAIRERGHEYGTTTGRARRCGWFDAVVARYTNRINGFTSAAITRLDVLDDLPSLKICTAYKLNGKTITEFPASIAALEKCQPIYEDIPGWQSSTNGASRFEDLPENAQRYINRLEQLIGCPVSIISDGMRREQTIHKIQILPD